MYLIPSHDRAGAAPVSFTFVPRGARLPNFSKETPAAFGRTLRIALAMRGGISLAVWIGGAVAELDLLRRIRLVRDGNGEVAAYIVAPRAAGEPTPSDARARAYATMLGLAGYDRVEFDILAGASAGGLNGVVYSVAQRMGTPVDDLLDAWVDLGGVDQLMHPPGGAPVDSLFRGDGYFWPGLQRALLRFAGSSGGHPDLVASQVSVDLSATIIDGQDSTDQDTSEGRGHFHFASRLDEIADWPAPELPDLPNGVPSRRYGPGGEPETSVSDAATLAMQRLAYAARTTSSFPGAFEPARIFSPAGAPSDPSRAVPPTQMRFAFGAHRVDPTGTKPYRVVDGGVFDNIPIERALSAARTRASTVYAERALIYLDPSPAADQSLTHPWKERVSRFLSTILAAISRLQRRESEAGEVDEVREFSRQLALGYGRVEAVAELVPDTVEDWAPAPVADRLAAYLRYRGGSDTNLISGVLTAPGQWQLTTDLGERRRYSSLREDYLAPIDRELNRRLDAASQVGGADAAAILTGAQTAIDTAQCLLAFTRSVDYLVSMYPAITVPPGVSLREVRRTIYRVLRQATFSRDEVLAELLQKARELTLTREFSRTQANAAGPAEERVTALLDAWFAPPAAPVAGFFADLDGALGALRELAAHLSAQADSPDPALPHAQAFADRWRETPWSRLPSGATFGAVDVTPIFAATGIPPVVSHVNFGRVTSDEQPSAPAEFPLLRASALRSRLRRALSGAELAADEIVSLFDPANQRLTSETKLAGAGVFNFGGFLDADWRRNDWWWGRMDAASGIGRFLASATAPPVTPEQVRGAIPELQASIRAEAGAEPGLQRAAQRLDDLPAGYRLALASRGLRVVGRALTRPLAFLWRLILEVGLLALNWVRVVVPLLADPPRAAVAGVVMLATTWLVTFPGAMPAASVGDLANPFVIGALLLVVVLVVRSVLRASRRWGTTVDALGDGEYAPTVLAHRRRARGLSAAVVATALLAVLAAAAALGRDQVLPGVLLIAAAIGLALAVGPLARIVGDPVPARTRGWWVAASVLALAWLAGVIGFALFPAPLDWLDDGPYPRIIAVVGGLLVLGTLAGAGWLSPLSFVVVVVGAPAIAGLAALALVSLVPLPLNDVMGWALGTAVTVWGTLYWWMPELTQRDETRYEQLAPVPAVAG
jgi:predicted acylesterase/phospholipase RssA